MLDFEAARRMMVDGQVRTSDVTDLRLIGAMLAVPRERFLPPAQEGLAYLDLDVAVRPAGEGGSKRFLVKPMVLAKLIQAAEIGAGDRVLDVGCATGYSSAVLARLAHSVVALEQDPDLANQAAQTLAALGQSNVSVVRGSLTEGWSADAPYDVIFVNGAVEMAPSALEAQLKDGGRLVAVLRRLGVAKAMLYVAAGRITSARAIFNASAPVLPGFSAPAAFVF